MNELCTPVRILSIQKKIIVSRENNPFDNRKGMLDEIQETGMMVISFGAMSQDLNSVGTWNGPFASPIFIGAGR